MFTHFPACLYSTIKVLLCSSRWP